MCGRLNVGSDPLNQIVSDALDVSFSAVENSDLRPSEALATLAARAGKLSQVNAQWGIKPAWAKKLLINAQAETVADKPTFKKSFIASRCIVPCSGWYEWKSCGSTKIKYYFTGFDHRPVYMAGILFPDGSGKQFSQLVTLTTQATPQAVNYHHRMPLIIPETSVHDWLLGTPEQAVPLLHNATIEIAVNAAA